MGDIIHNLSRKSNPKGGNIKDKIVFYSAIMGGIQRLERLSRVNYIDRTELESCLSEHDLWGREMTVAGLDFKNPVGIETFNCFKKVCIIECNTNESSRSEPTLRETPMIGVKKPGKSSHNVQQMEDENSSSDTEATAQAVAGPPSLESISRS